MSSSSRTAIPPQHLSNLMYTLPIRRLKAILSHVITDTTVTLLSVEDMTSTQLSRLYTLNMSDERKLMLALSPSLTVRLLRHEHATLCSEAALVSFLSSSLQARQQKEGTEARNKAKTVPNLARLIPKLLKHSQTNREVGYPYSIFEPTAGVPLSSIAIYLSLPERRVIDIATGRLARELANFVSPTGRFGLISKVLPDEFTSASPSSSPSTTAPAASEKALSGSKTWAEAFHILLEHILRDGEDMSVVLPYDAVRAQFRRLVYLGCFDAVIVPRLVVLNLGDESNVLVERGLECDMECEEEDEGEVKGGRITGLRSWSQGVFGDPLIAGCFGELSEGFLEGWSRSDDGVYIGANRDSKVRGGCVLVDDGGEEERTHERARKLLYGCYGSIVKVVTEYYRPQHDSSSKEMDARRRLTSLLGVLEVDAEREWWDEQSEDEDEGGEIEEGEQVGVRIKRERDVEDEGMSGSEERELDGVDVGMGMGVKRQRVRVGSE